MRNFAWLLLVTSILLACDKSLPSALQAEAGTKSGTATTGGTLQDSSQVVRDYELTFSPDKAYVAYVGRYEKYNKQYYVSPSGSDINSGRSKRSAWATLAHADKVAPACAVIWFLPGTWDGRTTHVAHTTTNGTAKCHRAYVSTTYAGAVLKSSSNSTNAGATWWESGDYTDHVGFDLSSGSCDGFYADGTTGYDVFAYNRIHDVENALNSPACGAGVGGAGIVISSHTTNTLLENNVVWNVGKNQNEYVHGIYPSGLGDVTRNNLVYNASGGCIHAYGYAQNQVIVNNTLVGCGTWGLMMGAYGNMSGMFVANNIIAHNGFGSSLGNRGGLSECNGRNCGGASGNTITNNLFYGNYADITIPRDGTDTAVHSVSANPRFVNKASPGSGGDFHLQQGSPGIGAGIGKIEAPAVRVNSDAPATDIDGNRRGNPPSIGAYE